MIATKLYKETMVFIFVFYLLVRYLCFLSLSLSLPSMATNRIIVLSNEYEQQHFEELQKIVVNLTNCCRNEVNKDIENQWTRLVAVANEYFQLPTTEHDNNEIARVIVDIIYICAAYSDVDKPWCSPAISDKVDGDR
ncbi:hypothetical protein BDF22DRAFT_306115 [Syncephalis plumigaleata]|nr:hypothetical protein BDF22DRAFT_306115 [Syncephalis plumigaleata]